MGLFDSLFGSSSKSNSTTNSSGTTNQTQQNQASATGTTDQTTKNGGTTSQTGTQTSTTQQTGTQAQTTQNLDADTVALLKQLLPGLATNAAGAGTDTNTNSDALKKVADVAFTNGTGGNASTVDAAIAADQAQAKTDFAKNEGKNIASLQQGIGSKNNTYAAQLGQQGDIDLATALSKISADAKLNELGLNNNSLQTAIAALTQSSAAGATDSSAALAPLLSVISSLKGANSTTTGQTTQQGTTAETSAIQTIQDLISKITGTQTQEQVGNATATGVSTGFSKTDGKTTNTPGIIPSFMSLF